MKSLYECFSRDERNSAGAVFWPTAGILPCLLCLSKGAGVLSNVSSVALVDVNNAVAVIFVN